MNFLISVMHAIHYTIGISMPPKEKEPVYALLWVAIFILMAVFLVSLFFILMRLI